MKFIFVTRESYKDAGARIRCYAFSRELKKKGIDTDVFSFVDRLGAKSGKEDAEFKYTHKLSCILKGFKLLLKEDTVTIFIVNRFNYHALSVWMASKIKGIPFIFDMDDWEARENIWYFWGVIPSSKAEYLTRLFARESVVCVAASNYLKGYLSQFNRNVYYIPTGVDTTEFRPSPYKEKKELVFSWHGSINRPEILRYLTFIIECFCVLYKKYPYINLYIAGDGIFGEEVSRIVKVYNCNGITYRGYVSYDKIPSYLDEIDIGLIPLLDRTPFNLSKSPVKLFEYMAKGKPVVASPVGEVKYIVNNGIDGFWADTQSSFIEKMEMLINNVDLRIKMGSNARKKVEREYSLSVISDKVYEMVRQNVYRTHFYS